MNDCIFCKIAKGEIPSKKIYEDGSFIAFLDVNPRAKGHTLVIPKSHAKTITDLNLEDSGSIFRVVTHLAKTITERLNAKGYNIGSNNGEAAGQAVPHAHIHIIPRYEKDKHSAGFEAAFEIKEDEKKELDSTLKTVTRGSLLPPLKTIEKAAKPERESGAEKKEHKWSFTETDDITEDTIEH